jgi:chromosome segregation ATPase
MAMKVIETMDLAQAMQTIKFLDEDRRKDKVAIATLHEKIEEQERKLAQQALQIQEQQIELAGLQGTLSQVTGFEQMVSNFKKEIVYLVEQREETRRKEQTESERLRRIEHEAFQGQLGRLEKELRVLPRYDEDLDARKAEEERLSTALQRLEVLVATLDKRSEDRVQAVSFLEEQRRADNRRIAEMEPEIPDLHRKHEALNKKLPLLEEMLQKQQIRIEEAIQETKKYEKPIEELRISDFQREQKMQMYLDQGEQVNLEMERIRTQTQGFFEQQQLVKRALEKVESFQIRIEKRQNEIAEMQRMAEDRLKRQWEEWVAEQLQRQKKQDVVIEERWRQQERTNDAHLKRLDALPPIVKLYGAQLDALWEARRAEATRALKAIQDEHEILVAQIDEQLIILRGEQRGG